MITLYKNIEYKLELVVLDDAGKFTPGLSITYEIRKCSDDSLFASGTMSETSSVYYVDVTFTVNAEYKIKYVTPTGYEDGFEDILVEDYNNYKADVSALALETTVAKDSTVAKDATVAKDVTVAKDATVAKEITLNTKASQSSVNAIKSDTESIITTLSTLVVDIWGYTTRTLTSFDTLVTDISLAVWSYTTRTITAGGITASEIWGYLTRTLTSGTKDAEIDAIKERTENLPDDPASESGALAKENSLTTLAQDATVAKETTLNTKASQASIDAIKTETDKIKFILGLSQENYKLFDIVYSGDLITSTTIKTYPSAIDCENNTNPLATYSVVATYDLDGKLLTYQVKKE